MPQPEALSRMTLEQAITASKALEAAARRYRNDADTYPIGHSHIATLINRARDCEHVAKVLVSGARIT